MNWPTVELSTAFEFIRNGMSVKQNSDAGGLPITRIETISDGAINPQKVGFAGLSESDATRWLLEPGDILLSHINSFEHVGKCAIYRSSPEKLVHGMNLLCLRPDKSKLDPEYAKHTLRTPQFRSSIERFINKAVNQASISIGNLSTVPIFLPSLEEQRRIAAILDLAEQLRAKRRAAIALLDQLPQSIFLEMFGDPATNPLEWPKKRFGDVTSKFSDGPFGSNLKSAHYTSDGVRVWRLQNIGVGELLDEGRAYISESHFEKLHRHLCVPGDVIVGTLGDPNLRAFIQPDIVKRALNKADCVQIRPLADVTDSQYLCWLCNSKGMESLAQSGIQGQTRLRISMGRLREISIPVPPIQLQHQFASRVEAIHRTKAAHQSALTELDALFASLQSKAFSGELSEKYNLVSIS
jgi:type I restriction enzyme, S subunit